MINKDLIEKIMKCFFENDKEILQFKNQYKNAKIINLEKTSKGFFVDFDVKKDLIIDPTYNDEFKHVYIEFYNPEELAGCVVFVREGKLDFLECFSFGDTWPVQVKKYKVVCDK